MAPENFQPSFHALAVVNLIGASQALLSAAALVGTQRGNRPANRYFAFFLAALAVYIIMAVLLETGYDRAELRRILMMSLLTNPKPPAPPKPNRNDKSSVAAYSQYLERIYGVRWPEAEVRATKRFDTSGRCRGEVANGSTGLKILQGEEQPEYNKIAAPALALFAIQESVEQAYPWPFGSPLARLNAWNWHTGRWKPFAKTQVERFEKEVAHGQVVKIAGNHYLFLTQEDEIVARIKSFLR